jgi:hypothetical protein
MLSLKHACTSLKAGNPLTDILLASLKNTIHIHWSKKPFHRNNNDCYSLNSLYFCYMLILIQAILIFLKPWAMEKKMMRPEKISKQTPIDTDDLELLTPENLIKNAPFAFIILDKDLKVLSASHPMSGFIGKPYSAMFPNVSSHEVMAICQTVIATGQPHIVEVWERFERWFAIGKGSFQG